MLPDCQKIGVIVPDWDDLCRNPIQQEIFAAAAAAQCAGRGVIILSRAATNAVMTSFTSRLSRCVIVDARFLSPARLTRLCEETFLYKDSQLHKMTVLAYADSEKSSKLGLIVSNGYGLGHVRRMQAFARGLAPYAPVSFMSFSAALWRDVFYLPSPQYLQLDEDAGNAYCREAVLRFFAQENPTHVIYDGNVVPSGLLMALALRPHIHLTWVRRGMWQADTKAKYMARQALADLVIEPGDFAQDYDTGPSWNARQLYCPPGAFLKTQPIRSSDVLLSRDDACHALGLEASGRYGLLMPGAQQGREALDDMHAMARAIRSAGMVPVIAHWPMSHVRPPHINGAVVIERMPLIPYFNAFDLIVSAAGYNSFHEILATDIPAVFVPQEDKGRDQQLARARWAADQGLAQLCRREALTDLPAAIKAATKRAPLTAGWMEGWSRVASAMQLQDKASGAYTNNNGAMHIRVKRLLKQAHRHSQKQQAATQTRFVYAQNITNDVFLKKCKALKAARDVIITDSIDPVLLRRAGFRYLWLNTRSMPAIGLKRQILNWLRIWQPQKIKTL